MCQMFFFLFVQQWGFVKLNYGGYGTLYLGEIGPNPRFPYRDLIPGTFYYILMTLAKMPRNPCLKGYYVDLQNFFRT